MSDGDVSCTAPATRNGCGSSSKVPRLRYKTLTFCWFLTRFAIPCACHAKRHLNVQKCTCGAREMENCTPLWREARFQVKMYKAHQFRTTFGSWDVEKVHAVVARRTRPSQNVQNAPLSDHFWKLTCRKKSTPLWREAHFQVKMLKTPQIIGNTQCFATFLPFRAPGSWFFWGCLFFWSSSSLLFAGSSHLCFSICPYCRKFDF